MTARDDYPMSQNIIYPYGEYMKREAMCDEIDRLRAELAEPSEGAVTTLASAMVDDMLKAWPTTPTTHEPTLRKAVADTFRTIAEWGSVGVDGDVTREECIALATQIETQPTSDWCPCPICQETECDPGCPLEPLRKG